MFALFRTESFFNIWYWILTVTVWTAVCHRTLGVPHDMVLRAARLPGAARRVDLLARIGAERLTGVAESFGAPLAAAAGFGLATLAGLGYVWGNEPAKAAFVLLAPLSAAALGGFELARDVIAQNLAGEALRKRLARRRMLNQSIAVLAILFAAVTALGHPPRVFAF